MPAYRYLAADLLTGIIREEIPFESVKFKDVLNRPGAFSGSIGLRHAKASRSNLDPGRTVIHVERDGIPVWSGIMWTARGRSSEARVDVGAEGWWSYFRRRFIRTTKAYAAQDQLYIARDLLTYAQGIAGGNIGLTIGSETSGVLRDRTYNAWELKNVAEAVEQLAAVKDGFDFSIDLAWSGTIIAKTFHLWYPRRGSVTALVFELGTNLEDLGQEVDASTQANLVTAAGAGEGAAMLLATSIVTAAPYPLLEDVVSAKDVSDSTTLQAAADRETTGRGTPVVRLPDAGTFQPHPDTKFGAYSVGDTVTVRGTDGWVSVSTAMRVVEVEVTVDAQGQETVVPSLAPEAASL